MTVCRLIRSILGTVPYTFIRDTDLLSLITAFSYDSDTSFIEGDWEVSF